MKKSYETPVLGSEEFASSDYVAVCWELACVVNGNDASGAFHQAADDGKGCGHAKNQVIQQVGNRYRVVEENVPDNPGKVLECFNMSPALTVDNIKDYAGKEITWETVTNRTYYHRGYITMKEASRPLHS